MLTGDKFRVVKPLLGIMSNDGNRIPVMLPKGAILEIVTGLVNHERMVDVRWETNIVMLFVEDVRTGCRPNIPI